MTDRFSDFLSHIESAALRQVARHWQEIRQGRRMPAFRDIEPEKIARHLPIFWAWRYDRERDDFTGRLAGEEVRNIFGKSLRGVRMEDFFPPEHFPQIFQRCRRVVIEPCFSRDFGRVFLHANRSGHGERLILPVADDGDNGNGIVGATTYKVDEPFSGGNATPMADNIEYYPL